MQIKFRGIRKDHAHSQFPKQFPKKKMEFAYGTGVYKDIVNTWLILENSEKKTFSELRANIVIPETVGQFINETDMDGKEIYSGDIVSYMEDNEFCHHSDKILGVVKYDDGCFIVDQITEGKVVYREGKEEHPLSFYDNEGKVFSWDNLIVVGNKFQHPELLAGENN